MLTIHDEDVLFTALQIQQGVAQVAAKLNHRYQDLVMITVVPGGLFFSADLARQLTAKLSIDTISCPHTPGENENRSPIIFQQNVQLTGRDVVLVDDAIESGGTMARLVSYLTQHYQPRSLAVATLFVKAARRTIDIPQYYAYEVDTADLLVGYGLPWNDQYRNLPYIACLPASTR